MKKNAAFLAIILLFLCVVFISACVSCVPDYDFELGLTGLFDEAKVLTKAEILDFYNNSGKKVIFDNSNPCYSMDKTDIHGNPLPYTLKGVYFDDLIEYFFDISIYDFKILTLYAEDGYEAIVTRETFSEEEGGTRMIIAVEFGGELLTKTSESGSLRVIFPDKEASVWVKMLRSVAFSNETIFAPSPSVMWFIEAFGDNRYGSFDKKIDADNPGYSYYGVSFEKLFTSGILSAVATDKMYISAWDYPGKEYYTWKTYFYYRHAFLTYTETFNGVTENLTSAPVFYGANIQHGLEVKNVMYVAVGNTALMSLNTAFKRFDTENTGEITLFDILTSAKIQDSDSVTVTRVNGDDITVLKENYASTRVLLVEGEFLIEGKKIRSVGI